MKEEVPSPPKYFLRFFRWFCRPELRPYIEGDLMELYEERSRLSGKRRAGWRFIIDVLLLFRPAIIKPVKGYEEINQYDMFKSYFKVGLRIIIRDKAYSIINIGGLTVGMAVVFLIGLWIYDELTFNKHHANYNSIANVVSHASINHGIVTHTSLPLPVSAVLRTTYSADFKNVAATWSNEQIISSDDKVLTRFGCFSEPALPEMLTLEMISGTQNGLNDRSGILLSESLARVFFDNADPVNKEVRINNASNLFVKGVYKDIPANSSFNGTAFFAPIQVLVGNGGAFDNWNSSSFNIFVELNPTSEFSSATEKIKNVYYENAKDATHPKLFLTPMSKWHLYEFRNGEEVAGRLRFVWLFGIIGAFVLFLACINFMNLSTARSEKRAKEVGIRKAIGSLRKQLINQFLSESFLITLFAFVLSIGVVSGSLSWFNELSGKQMTIPWSEKNLWLIIVGSVLTISLIAGSYPAFYLSSFQPVRVLKGTFKSGRFSSIPRKLLVVVQFTASIVLIIGTLIVYNQIQFAKDRPTGYDREGVLTIPLRTAEIGQHYEAFRLELLKSNAALNATLSSSPSTNITSSADNLDWKGKDPNSQFLFGTISIDPFFDDVLGWKIKEGRNFSDELSTDSTGFIFNEAAIEQMGLKEPIGEIVRWHGKDWHIIGVVRDMVMISPFGRPVPTVFMIDNRERSFNTINVKLNPASNPHDALATVEKIFKKYAPSTPFDYRFSDQEYAWKFASEERIGKLATLFSFLATIISCLGLFGLASFVADQRTKEIGIRKVMGASALSIWKMLCSDFVLLVIISLIIATPVSYYILHNWLNNYEYHTEMSWWIFASAGAMALLVTLLTVSYQALVAAFANPVKSLRSE